MLTVERGDMLIVIARTEGKIEKEITPLISHDEN
jgi:hypothetical protein